MQHRLLQVIAGVLHLDPGRRGLGGVQISSRAGPQRGFTAAFGPFIRHLNSTANRFVRRFGLEPAEELASARSPEELVALARRSAAQGAL